MRDLSIAGATALYAHAAEASTRRHTVSHPQVHRSIHLIRQFVRSLAENDQDDYWLPYLRWLSRYRFHLCAAPLPFGHSSIFQQEQADNLKVYLARSSMIFPLFSHSAQELLSELTELAAENANPLLGALMSLVTPEEPKDTALLLKERRMIPAVEEVLNEHSELSHLQILTASDLRNSKCHDQLIVVGPAYWFPDHVFTAPRAGEIHLIRYSCNPDTWPPEPTFVNPLGRLPQRFTEQEGIRKGPKRDDIVIAPGVEDDIERQVEQQIEGSWPRPSSSDLDARLFLLSDGWLVYLDADENSSSLVIDIDENEVNVERVLVTEIETGMYVLVRTEGGGDYIVSVADRILGDKAAQCRATQRHWKRLLRQKVEARDVLSVSIALLDLGSIRANEQNVRNWMSERSIRTHDYADFAAIMKLIGLTEQASDYWKIMGTIRGAHRKAGNRIRNSLLQQVRRLEPHQLEREGRMDFELGDEGGGRLAGFRVDQVFPTTVKVPSSRIAHPFSLGHDIWPR